MEFVIVMILFDVYVAIVRYRSVRVRENINMTVKIFCVCLSVDVCGTKARMHTYKYSLFLTALMFQNLLQLTIRQGKKIYIL